MIRPQLAAMVVYLFSDVGASPRELQSLLREACDQSLNCMSIDGDTSTNDTVLLLASGGSGGRGENIHVPKEFSAALTSVWPTLAQKTVNLRVSMPTRVRFFLAQARG